MKNKHLIQRLENREDLTEKEMIKLIDEIFYQLRNKTPWGLRYYYNFLKNGKYEPTYKDVEDGINKTIKSLKKL